MNGEWGRVHNEELHSSNRPREDNWVADREIADLIKKVDINRFDRALVEGPEK